MIPNPETTPSPEQDPIKLLEQALEKKRSALGEEKYNALVVKLERLKNIQEAINVEKKIIAEKEEALVTVRSDQEKTEAVAVAQEVEELATTAQQEEPVAVTQETRAEENTPREITEQPLPENVITEETSPEVQESLREVTPKPVASTPIETIPASALPPSPKKESAVKKSPPTSSPAAVTETPSPANIPPKPRFGGLKRFLRNLGFFGGAAAISGFAGSGIERNSDGGLGYDTNKLVEVAIAPLPETPGQWAKRGLSKAGIYDIPEAHLQYSENENALVLKDFPKVTPGQDSENPEIQSLREKLAKLEYFKTITYTTKIAEVIDYKASTGRPKNEQLKLWSFRNQWANEQGFQYIPTPNKGNQRGQETTYNDVLGVAHFLLDCDISQGQRNFNDDYEPGADHFVHKNNAAYLRIGKEHNHYVPTFTREGERVRVKYKKFDELEPGEKIMAPLRQVSFDDIDFNATQKVPNFLSAREVMLKQGLKNPYRHDGDQRGTFFLFTGDKTSYSQYSGTSVVFIFEDNQGNRIIRDFAGSINDIQQEGLAIEKEFALANGTLTIGIHDVGSFSAKPVADQNNTYRTSQSAGYNWSDVTGGGLLIPRQQLF